MALEPIGPDADNTAALAALSGLDLSRYWSEGPAVFVFLRHFG